MRTPRTNGFVERFNGTVPEEFFRPDMHQKMLESVAALLEQTGMRLEEAASLTWKQVDLVRNRLVLTKTKARRVRAIELSQMAAGTLVGTPRRLNCPWVFWRENDGEPDRLTYVVETLSRTRKALGFAWRTHDLRHRFAVRYLENGGSIYELQAILGHSTIKVTEGYLDHLTPAEAARAKEDREHGLHIFGHIRQRSAPG